MSNRVNITYSVSLDELDIEVRRLIEKAYQEMEDVLGGMRGFKEPLSLETFQHLDRVRQQLASVDAGLSDINNIVSSYLNYKVSNLAPPPVEDSPPIEADEERMAEALGTLQEKLALFKQQAPVNEVAD